MKCKRCPHTQAEHVFTDASIVHACKRCTCDSFVGTDSDIGKLYDAPWGRYEIYSRKGDEIVMRRSGSYAYVVVNSEKLARDYKEASFRVPPPTAWDARPTNAPDQGGARPAAATRPDRTAAPAKRKRAGAPRATAGTPAAPADGDGPIRDLFRVDASRGVRSTDDLHPAFRPLGVEPAHVPVPAAPPAPVRHLGLDLDDDRTARAARGWVPPPLTLGAVRPGGALISVPDRLLQYWLPCAKPEDGAPHAWFIADNLAPSIYCDDCREQRPARAMPEAASIPADHPRARTWTLWSWAAATTTCSPAGSSLPPATTDDPKAEVADFARPARQRGKGLPPWEHDPRGPIWEWADVGPKARVVAREVYEERAAIMEYDGGLTREEAEYRAYGALLRVHERHYGGAA